MGGYQPKVYREQGGDKLVVASGGLIEVQAGGQINLLAPQGDVYFVDPANGDDDNAGTSWVAAFETMEQALDTVGAGDTIYFTGTVKETSLTLDVAGVRIIGAGPSPNSNIWQQPDAAGADTTLLTVTAGQCSVENIRFRIPTSAAPDGSARGIELTGAHWFQAIGCMFQGRSGSGKAIATNGSADNVRIAGCRFMFLNTATHGCAIYGHTYPADVIGSNWLIEDCVFHSNVNHIVVRLRQSVVRNCQFSFYGLAANGSELSTTVCINLSGGANAKWNLVTGNLLGGGYSTDAQYVGGTNDDWTGNFSADVDEAEVADNGVTVAPPAA